MDEQQDYFDRTKKLIGEKAFLKLQKSTVAIVGVGGVGGACCEALCRAGVGKLIIIDHDTVATTNLNRQIVATINNIGIKKTKAMKSRLNSIIEECEIIEVDEFYEEDTKHLLFSNNPDFVVDAIDTIKSKINLAKTCKEKNVPIIACLGTGNRLDPTKFTIGDIADTKGCGCGLARVMRHEYKANDILNIEVLYSNEIPRNVVADNENGRHSPGSISFCPPVAGYIIASRVIAQLIKNIDFYS